MFPGPCMRTPISGVDLIGAPVVSTVRGAFVRRGWTVDYGPRSQTDKYCVYLVDKRTDAVVDRASRAGEGSAKRSSR